MTIKPKQDSFMVRCDFCLNYLEIKSGNFPDALKEMRFNGWKTFKDKTGKTVNQCQACQRK